MARVLERHRAGLPVGVHVASGTTSPPGAAPAPAQVLGGQKLFSGLLTFCVFQLVVHLPKG